MTVYITSDTHFNHAGILRHCPRPWSDVDEMNEGLMNAWNDTVSDNDDVWVLGDWAYRTPDGIPLDALFMCLNGRKHLIVGNHDDRNPDVLRLPWRRIERLHRLRWEGRRAILCHYPLETWDGAHHAGPKAAIMLHGHSHGSLRRIIPHRYDVGVDAWGARYGHGPIPLADLFAYADTEAFDPADHHGL